ncbi:MAG: DUF421 domain-containing protein [Pyrinomonadaceae bacterium]
MQTQPKPIQLTDWHRILAGGTPWEFLLEVVLRAAFTYLLLMVAMRLLGKRVAAQLTLFELSMVVTMAAVIGIPLQVPDRGLLPPVVLLAVLILLQRALAYWSVKRRRVELLAVGDLTLLARDGRMLLEGMRETVLAREKVYAALRGQGVQHLGQVRRVYLEPSGDLSLIKYKRQRPGLLIIPELDSTHGRYEKAEDRYACSNCGHVVASDHEPLDYCESCGEPRWTEAVTEAGAGEAHSSKRDSTGLARKAG